jgi:hypothetical protein
MSPQLQCITALLVIAVVVCACGPTYKTVEVSAPAARSEGQDKPSGDAFDFPSESGPKPVKLDGYRSLEWKLLRGLDVKSGKSSAELTAFIGGNVKINGFMVPFDDDEEEVSEFLLVPQAGMCIHTPPPPPNQIILVEVGTGGANRVEWDKEVSVYGQFQIAEGNSPYGKTGFKISAIRARPD